MDDVQWCKSFMDRYAKHKNKPIDCVDYKQRYEELKEWGRDTFPASGHFTKEWLNTCVTKIDRLWYEDRLLEVVKDLYGRIEYKAHIKEKKVAGYVIPWPDRMEIAMNSELTKQLFTRGERGYHAGGRVCSTRFDCLLYVLLHETLHVLLAVADRLGLHKEVLYHGKVFRHLRYNLFWQTDSQHGLIPGFEQVHSLVYTRKHLKPGVEIQFFLPHEEKWINGVVLKVHSKNVKVKLKDGSKMMVHAGLLRLKYFKAFT